jgi:hypothetical protein
MVLVEGQNDRHFVYNLCQRLSFQPEFDVESEANIQKAIFRFATELKGNRTQPLGLIVDADFSAEARKSEIIREIKDEFPVTIRDFTDEGLVVKPENEQKFGIWIWPDNQKNGILEDLYLELVQDDDLLLKEANRVVENLPNIAPIRFKPQHKSKAIVHTWLAWQDNPGSPIGDSIKRSTINLERPVIQKFKTWLQNLYSND